MAQFHFVEDYERYVEHLLATYPMDEAMGRAVGGSYEHVGRIEAEIMRYAGLKDRMYLLDMGCGSGRLAWGLSNQVNIRYTGIDIIQSLLDYAKTKSPSDYEFLLHRELNIPLPDQTIDLVAAFSLFTHLLHGETYLYLEEIKRILKPAGKLVFSFLEFDQPAHWPIFQATVESHRQNARPNLDMFIERSAIRIWADRLGFSVPTFIGATESPWKTEALGQSVAILEKI